MKRKQRSLAALLAGAVVASSMSFSAFAADFTDTQNHWGASSVERWADYGVVNGANGKFNPDAPMTRAEMATVLVNLLGLEETAPNNFSDVQAGAWYEDAMLKCAAAGIIKGDGTGANPNGQISREEAAVMLGRALGIEPATGSLSFGDGAQVSDWAAGYVKAMSDKGIINGVGGDSFAPSVQINRASVTTILDKSISTYVNTDGETVTASGNGITLVAAKNVTVTGDVKGGLLVAPATAGAAVTVKDATVSGGVTVQGSASVALTGTTSVDTVKLTAEGAKLSATAETSVQSVTASAARTEVTVAGTVGTIAVTKEASGAAVKVESTATVKNVETAAPSTALSVAGKVDNVAVASTAQSTTVTTEKGATIAQVNTTASGTTVKGEGTVTNVTTDNKNNVTVSTPGTTVKEDKTDTSTTTPPAPSGGSGGGSSDPSDGSSSGSSTPTSTPADVAELTLDANMATEYSVSAVKWSNKSAIDVTVKANNLKLSNRDEHDGYWIGIGVPMAENATMARSWGVVTTVPTQFTPFDGTTEKDGKKYGTVYFNVGSVENNDNQASLFVKNGTTVTSYLVDFTGVKTARVVLLQSAVSTSTFPTAISSTEDGLSRDESAELASGQTLTLSQEKVAKMGDPSVGGQYVVYYTVPKASIAKFDAVKYAVNGGQSQTWDAPFAESDTSNNGWRTQDDANYYFKIGGTFATKAADNCYTLKNGGVFAHSMQFIVGGNVIGELDFTVDFSGVTITPIVAVDPVVLDKSATTTVVESSAFDGLEAFVSDDMTASVNGQQLVITGTTHALKANDAVPGFGTVGTTEGLTTKSFILPLEFLAPTGIDWDEIANDDEAFSYVKTREDGTEIQSKSVTKADLGSPYKWQHLLQCNTDSLDKKTTFTLVWAGKYEQVYTLDLSGITPGEAAIDVVTSDTDGGADGADGGTEGAAE